MTPARSAAAPEAHAVQQLAALEDVLEDARGRLSACLRLLDANGPRLHLVATSGATSRPRGRAAG